MINSDYIIAQLEKRLSTFNLDTKQEHIGIIEKNNDGVISASGLSKVAMGEIVTFEKGGTGVVLNLSEDTVSIILLDTKADLKQGDIIKRTNTLLSIPVSEDLLGRIVDPIGNPLDGKAINKKGKLMPLERIAAGVVQREPVNKPLKTGIKAIDTMIPIGRGQRELIIGDRGLGKTAIAIDTIINQKINNITIEQLNNDKKISKKEYPPQETNGGTKPVICIYVAIGQKQSSIAQTIGILTEKNAMEYTIIVAAPASAPASMQYLAPYAGTAIAEYFMEKGQDVLIVHDDLTKHAWAYRQLSLIMQRPAGREAYPGDIFYLHSRLLERSVKLNPKEGGGSITALPIIETQASDISAYIPTNVISITDGQIYLEPSLFNIGIRPAINPGNSVSRVGGAAQTKAIKSVSGKLRLDLAQYNSLAAFAQFGSELDDATLKQLERGKRIVEILKQPRFNPLSEALEILSIWVVTNGYLDDLAIEKVSEFETQLHEYVTTHAPKIIKELSKGEKLSESVINDLKTEVEKFKKGFQK
jgi:F-type H+/Na+-transporting ATPase subunit alpha